MAQPQQMQQQNIQQSMDARPMDHDEKKMRRQIANSNERRRMQSINAGFQSLRQLLPHHEGEKLSKVSQDMTFNTFCLKTGHRVQFVLDQFLFEISSNRIKANVLR